MPTRWTSALTWLASLALMVGLYAGAYYATVVPAHFVRWHQTIAVDPYYVLPGEAWDYALVDPTGLRARVFAPMHLLDRRLRPYIWETVGPMLGPN